MQQPSVPRSVVIGRFQGGPHPGHVELIRNALDKTGECFIFIGSANQPRTPKNPFTFAERSALIHVMFPGRNIVCLPLEDFPYDDSKWANQITSVVGENFNLFGCRKDSSSYYLDLFTGATLHEIDVVGDYDATSVRNAFFDGGVMPEWVPAEVLAFMAGWKQGNKTTYAYLVRYQQYLIDYVTKWQAPFLTADAVVFAIGDGSDDYPHEDDSVLVIRRRDFPGQGLLALPGGFLDPDGETITRPRLIQSMMGETASDIPADVAEFLVAEAKRELVEETQIIAHTDCAGYLSTVYAAPGRSLRGVSATAASVFLFTQAEKAGIVVSAADDAADAFWIKVKDLKPEQMFEDHYHIITSEYAGVINNI